MKSHKRFEQVVLALASVAALVILPLYAVKVHLKTDYTDFLVYYRAAVRALQNQQIFTLTDGSSPFRYFPILMPLLSVFGRLPLQSALLVWYFLQYFFFAAGLYFIYKTVRVVEERSAKWVTALSFFFILRFCLDTFTIGQVSSLMFFGYCVGLYGFVTRRFFLSGCGLFIPTVFKIGPGISYALFLFAKTGERFRAWLAPVILTGALVLLTIICFGLGTFRSWIKGWIMIVSMDSKYYDASHYGSQSLKSVLLRSVKDGFLSSAQASGILVAAAVIGCGALLTFWGLRKPLDARGRGIFFSLGVFPYLWFMPETFKYSLTTLAIPISFLLMSKEASKFRTFALLFMFFGVSVAGKDLLPDALFFGLQRNSVPFIATLFLAFALFQDAQADSLMASEVPEYSLGPWKNLPPNSDCAFSVIAPVSLYLDSSESDDDHPYLPDGSPFSVLEQTCAKLNSIYGDRWEWIGVFSPVLDPGEKVALQKTAAKIAKRVPTDRLRFVACDSVGRSAALREGFLQSSGKAVYLMRWEQPVGAEFVEEASALIRSGRYCVVRANRRLSESRFEIPVKHFSVAYSRHRMGLFFNRLVRLFLPVIKTTDTHSGHVLLTRQAAIQVFALQTSPDFLFDLELELTAISSEFPETELPVRLYLFEEKSGGRIFAEMISILTGLPRLSRRYQQGCYLPLKASTGITADDWGLSPAINQGILRLAQNGIVKRVSLMANCQYLTDGLKELREIPGIRLGLHFNLTYGKALTKTYVPLRPRAFLARWILRRKSVLPAIRDELRAQLALLSALGIQADYFDGHHHIHVVPGLLSEIADLIKEARIEVVRLPYDAALKFSPRAPLLVFSWLAKGAIRRNRFKTMTVFYPMTIHFQDHGLLRSKINQNPLAEVIVHPAIENDLAKIEFPDSYADGRVREYLALQMLGYALSEQALFEQVLSKHAKKPI